MKYLKYLGLIAKVIGMIEQAKAGEAVEFDIKGVRVNGKSWRIHGKAESD